MGVLPDESTPFGQRWRQRLREDQAEDYVAKYRTAMIRVSGSIDQFGADYPLLMRVEVSKVRGF